MQLAALPLNERDCTACGTENTPAKWLVWRSRDWGTDIGNFCFEVNQDIQFSHSSRYRCSPQHCCCFPNSQTWLPHLSWAWPEPRTGLSELLV